MAQGIELMDRLTSRMAWLTDRQQILTQNISNADTPGFRAMEMKQPTFGQAMQRVQSVGLHTTNTMHIAGTSSGAGSAATAGVNRNPAEVYPTGNTVNLEDETRKAAENVMDYQLVSNIYRKQIGMLMTAAGRPR